MSGKYVTETIGTDAHEITRAARILRDGGLVAVPTETVYGLAARADNDEAVSRIYSAKGRPDFNPLIVHVASLELARKLLPRRRDAGLAEAVTAGLETVAIRMPSHAVMRAFLEESGLPIAAPSANRSGFISPTSTAHVLASLDGRIDAVIDGGMCEKGLESTIAAVRADGWASPFG